MIAQRRRETHSSSPLTHRVILVFITASPKLRRYPSLNPVSRRYVCTCFLCAAVTLSTDFNSTITFPATMRSARKPSTNLIPLVRDWHRDLAVYRQSTLLELAGKRHLIDCFQQSRSQLPVNRYRCAHHDRPDSVLRHPLRLCARPVPLRSREGGIRTCARLP